MTAIRRFERSASGSALGLDGMLERAGYGVKVNGSSFRVWAPGSRRPETMNEEQLSNLLDDIRVANGLEPIKKRDVE